MEFLGLIGLILILGMIVGSIVAFVSLGSISQLKNQVAVLKKTLADQSAEIKNLHNTLAQLASRRPPDENTTQITEDESVFDTSNPSQIPLQLTTASAAIEKRTPDNHTQTVTTDAADEMTSTATAHQNPEKNRWSYHDAKPKPKNTHRAVRFNLTTFLNGNGLLWIGATILSLGGIFLAKYSIEAGLIAPYLRVLAGALFGVGLVVAAEYLHQNPKRFHIQSEFVSGALASAGVVTCFAITLVAFDFYTYLSPSLAFTILALISLTATWLAVRYGPILAAIGLAGAYAVPLLVSTGSNNIASLLSYVAFISISAVWVYHLVQKNWLWWMSLTCHFLWLFVALTQSDITDIIAVTGFIFVSLYLYTVAPVLGWQCRVHYWQPLPTKTLLMPRKEQLGIGLSIACVIIFYLLQGFDNSIYVVVGLLSLVLLGAPLRHSAFDSWPFLSLLLVIFILINAPPPTDFTNNLFPFSGALLLVQVMSLVFSVYSMIMVQKYPDRHSYLLFLVLAPLTLYSLSYALYPAQSHAFLYTVWALQLIIYAAAFIIFAARSQHTFHKASYLIFTHSAIALVLTMLLSSGTLTIALCIHIAIMSVISHKYGLNLPNWILKIAAVILLARLTLSPWLDTYSTQEILGLHWSIVVYPIAFVCFYITKRHQNPQLSLWLDGAMLHIAALFVTTETSYFLQGHYINIQTLSWYESILLGMNWLILGSVYLWRAQHTHLTKLYTFFAMALYGGFIVMSINASVFHNPFISRQDIGQHIIINWLLPLWLVPSLVLLAVLKYNLIEQHLRRYFWIVSGVFLTLYINAVIRFSFHDGISFLTYSIKQSELYTYSLVWLAIAASFILVAQKRSWYNVNVIGFAILAIVVLKAFLIDLANLNGLYRALSFIGLGLSLVAIGWLFQRFRNNPSDS